MMAAFEELSLTKMTVTEAALRDGVFYDLIGRSLNVDMREQTTAEFQNATTSASTKPNALPIPRKPL